MLEAVRVRREGFSYRPFFSDFVTSYRAIAYPFTDEVVYCMHNVVCAYCILPTYCVYIRLCTKLASMHATWVTKRFGVYRCMYVHVCAFVYVVCVYTCVCIVCVYTCVCGVGCEADRGGLSGDPGKSRTDRLATGSKQGLPALLPRAQAAAATQRNGGWGHPYTEDVPWLPCQEKVSLSHACWSHLTHVYTLRSLLFMVTIFCELAV